MNLRSRRSHAATLTRESTSGSSSPLSSWRQSPAWYFSSRDYLSLWVVVVLGFHYTMLHSHLSNRKVMSDQEKTPRASILRLPTLESPTQTMSDEETLALIDDAMKGQDPRRRVVAIGLAQDTNEIQPNTWNLLRSLACEYQVSILITAKIISKFPTEPPSQGNNRQSRTCAPIIIEHENTQGQGGFFRVTWEFSTGRVKRLSKLRNLQRDRVRKLFFPSSNVQDYREAVVIVLDLDLWDFPTPHEIYQRVQFLQQQPEEQASTDIICASGRTVYTDNKGKPNQQHRVENHYYDLFATVYWPESWALPLYLRNGQNLKPREDPTVPSRKERNDTHNWDMNHQLAALHDATGHGLAPMRSCFSGLTLYRASVWLTPQCYYTLDDNAAVLPREPKTGELVVMRYASAFYGMVAVCEHVIFHECLHYVVYGINDTRVHEEAPAILPRHMAVDTTLLTSWLFH